jgi:RNA polymerase sigma-70 factor, ECF subfamily
MSSREPPTGDFDTDLTQLLPQLRVYALSLTRDSLRADDLVQQTVLQALAGRKSFQPGTNFPGWLFRIQRNEFISGCAASGRPSS